MTRVLMFLVPLSLMACGQNPEPQANPNDPSSSKAIAETTAMEPTAEQVTFAENAVPDDPALAEVYDRSCRLCHAVKGMNAPLTGHTADWNARIDSRGMDGLLTSTKQGYEMMPAMGQCADCSDDQYGALIEFMAAGK